jgi:hypothetical protein
LRHPADPENEKQRVLLVDTKAGLAVDVRLSDGWKAELTVVCRKATTIEVQRQKATKSLLKAERGIYGVFLSLCIVSFLVSRASSRSENERHSSCEFYARHPILMHVSRRMSTGSKFSYLHAQIIRARAAHVELALLDRASSKLKDLEVGY